MSTEFFEYNSFTLLQLPGIGESEQTSNFPMKRNGSSKRINPLWNTDGQDSSPNMSFDLTSHSGLQQITTTTFISLPGPHQSPIDPFYFQYVPEDDDLVLPSPGSKTRFFSDKKTVSSQTNISSTKYQITHTVLPELHLSTGSSLTEESPRNGTVSLQANPNPDPLLDLRCKSSGYIKPAFKIKEITQSHSTAPLSPTHSEAGEFDIPLHFNKRRRNAISISVPSSRKFEVSALINGNRKRELEANPNSTPLITPPFKTRGKVLETPQVLKLISPTKSSSVTTGNKPGPKPSKDPEVLHIDEATGEELILFDYSMNKTVRDFLIISPMIHKDTLEEQIKELTYEFKKGNAVYPKALVPRDQYKGNRFNYEKETNELGWLLSSLNTDLQDHRGLIQRAVDSWRNTRPDDGMISRRLKRKKSK